jgi:hypothetical protein
MSFGQRALITPLEAFDIASWRMIVALPAQIGRWIGDVDAGGGDDAVTAERGAIDDFLALSERKFNNIPLITSICHEARIEPTINPLREDVLFERANLVLTRLKAVAHPLETNAYKLLLIEMAEAVARAAPDREEGSYNLMNGATTGWYGLYPMIMNNVTRYGRGPQVSITEKNAINRLIDALDAAHLVQKWQITPDGRQNVRVHG